MATKKQQRRRQKERRHEWEYVLPDEEGNEVVVDPKELRAEKEAQRPATARTTAKPASGGRRPGREIKPPSWQRVGKRALWFAPLMFLLVMVTSRNTSLGAQIFTTLIMLAIFLPFSYLMDSLMYRQYLKRGGKPPAQDAGRREGRGARKS
jgi:hypothetical protein